MVTQRSLINGHNGLVMSHAGEIVLFGGSRDPGESGPRAALRELCEESGALAHLDDGTFVVGGHVARWVTESGFLVDGYVVEVPPIFVAEAAPEDREVARIGYLPWDAIMASPARLEYHGSIGVIGATTCPARSSSSRRRSA